MEDGRSEKIEYDIALSFAGEDRDIVAKFASGLVEKGVRVFYDDFEKAELWGKDLYQHLQVVYRDRARYCIIFVSTAYAKKAGTRHELKQAQARAIEENREYILPVRLDDTEIPGLNATVGYIDLRNHTVEELQKVALQKLFGHDVNDDDLPELTWDGELVNHRGAEVASFWPAKIEQAQQQTTYVVNIPRIRYGDESWKSRSDIPCGDCGAIKGEFHVPTCDLEQCPLCRGQALGCGCIVE